MRYFTRFLENKKTIVRVILLFVVFMITGGVWSRLESGKNDTELKIVNKIISCGNRVVDEKCMEEVSDELLARYGYETSLKIINKYQVIPQIQDCHRVSHYVGKKEYRRTGDLKSILVGPSANLCLQGFLHGAVIEYFTQKGVLGLDVKDERLIDAFSTICGVKNDFQYIGHFVECFHALGHASMIMTNKDLPRALEICDLLSRDTYRNSCYSGSLMENFDDTQSSSVASKYFAVNDYDYPCYELGVHYQKMCYRWKGEYFFGLTGNNFEKSYQLCLKIKDGFVNECILRMARSYTRFHYQDTDDVMSKCEALRGVEIDYCIQGVVDLIISDVNDSKLLDNYCKKNPNRTGYCYDVVIDRIRDWSSDTREEIEKGCGFIADSRYKSVCLGAF